MNGSGFWSGRFTDHGDVSSAGENLLQALALAYSSVLAASAVNHHGNLRVCQHLVGLAPENQGRYAFATVGCHEDKIAAFLFGGLYDGGERIGAINIACLDGHGCILRGVRNESENSVYTFFEFPFKPFSDFLADCAGCDVHLRQVIVTGGMTRCHSGANPLGELNSLENCFPRKLGIISG